MGVDAFSTGSAIHKPSSIVARPVPKLYSDRIGCTQKMSCVKSLSCKCARAPLVPCQVGVSQFSFLRIPSRIFYSAERRLVDKGMCCISLHMCEG